GLDRRGGIAGGAAATLHEIPKLLVLKLVEESRPLERSHLGGDPHDTEVVYDGFDDRRVGAIDRALTGVEAVRIARLSKKFPRLRRIVRPERWLPGELEAVGNDARGDPREPQRLRRFHGGPTTRVVAPLAQALSGP